MVCSPLGALHGNLPGLNLFRLGKGDGQDAVLAGGLHVLRVHLSGKPEHPAEKAGLPLPTMIIDIFLFRRNLALPPDEQILILKGNFQVFGTYTRKLRPDVKMVVVLGDVEQGVDSHPPGIALPAHGSLKKPVHLPLEIVQFLEGIAVKEHSHILSSIYQQVIQLYFSKVKQPSDTGQDAALEKNSNLHTVNQENLFLPHVSVILRGPS